MSCKSIKNNETNEVVNDVVTTTCPAVGYQLMSVCVPVTVTPYAETGTVVTNCCGDPTITPGEVDCGGVKNGSCTFTISQNICVEVPVVFGAVSDVGDTYVGCNGASKDNICTGCGSTPASE